MSFFKALSRFKFLDEEVAVEKVAEIRRCMRNHRASPDGVNYCDDCESYHHVDYYPWTEKERGLRALIRRLKHLRALKSKFSKIIYYHFKNGTYSLLRSGGFDYTPAIRQNRARFYEAIRYMDGVWRAIVKKEKLEEMRRRDHASFIKAVRANPFAYYQYYKSPDVILGDLNLNITEGALKKCKKTVFSVIRTRKYIVEPANYDVPNDPSLAVGPPVPHELLKRLRSKIHLLAALRRPGCLYDFEFIDVETVRMLGKRIKKFYNWTIRPVPITVEPESAGMKDDKGEPVTNIEQASNVVLTEEHPVDCDLPYSSSIPGFWQGASSSDVKGGFPQLTDRFIELTTFNWTNKDASGKNLLDLSLPQSLLNMDGKGACSRPNTIPFKIHALARYDMEVKIQINSQKFQIGQLIASWFYFTHLDAGFEFRNNLSNFSQTEHALITANVSNEATLYIPYNYYAPYIRTRTRSDMPQANNMGRFILSVLNPLTVSATGASQCSGTVWIRFCNAEFTGTIAGDVGGAPGIECEPESIFSNVMEGAVRGLMTSMTDQNRDNPPDPRAPMYLVPTAAHSWAAGTGTREPVHALRLDARGQHPYLGNVGNEMDISYVAGRYCFVKTITVTKDMASGKLLDSLEAAPMMDKKHYIKSTSRNNYLDTYALPPVAVISNLFNYWRGSISFRFDLIYSTVGHNARFLIAYVPGVSSSTKITLAQAKSSPHVIISLGETQSYTYNIPFISHRPFWSRRYTGNYERDQVNPPSMVYIFVLNPLVPMESVPASMYINLWMAAGPDFEVAVPVQPSIGLGYDAGVIYPSSQIVSALEGYYPYYWGTYYRVQDSKILVARHAATSGAASVFPRTYVDKTANKICYYYTIMDDGDQPSYKDNNGQFQTPKYGVIWPTGATDDVVFIPCMTEVNAKLLAGHLATHKADVDYLQTVNAAIVAWAISDVADTTDNTWSHGNPLWIASEAPFAGESGRDNDIAQAESPDKNVLDTGSMVSSTGFGLMLFGERFSSLKDLTRRYQLYGTFGIDIENSAIGQCSVLLPVLIQGMDIILKTGDKINEVANRCRDGHIPIIANGYRVGSGSVRFRVVVPCEAPVGIWVQHRPDRGLRSRVPMPCKEIETAEGIANHSYGSYLQLSNVNGVIEFEVPYYVPGPFCMLQRPYIVDTDDKYFYSLGELSIGFLTNPNATTKLKNLICTVYYALGDDSRLSLFQGFIPQVLLDDIKSVDPEGPEWEIDAAEEAYILDCIEAEPEGLFDSIRSRVVKSATKEGVEEVVQQVSTMVEPVLDTIETKVDDILGKITGVTGMDVANSPLTRQLLYSIINLSINPSLKTVLLSIVTVLIEAGFLGVKYAASFMGHLKTFLVWCKSLTRSSSEPNTEVQPEPVEVTAESPGEDKDSPTVGLLTAMWTALCGVLSYKGRKPKDLKSFATFVTSDMKNVFASANGMFTLLKNLVGTFQKMYEWILNKIYPDYHVWKNFDESYAKIKAWCEEVNYLVDPARSDEVMTDSDHIDRVSLAYEQGSIFLLPLSDLVTSTDRNAHKVLSVVKQQYSRITKLHNDCISMGVDSHIRKMCFTIAMYGDPGIGKSSLITESCKQLLMHANVSFRGPMICSVNPTDKYWSQCARQPVIVMDDLWAVETGDMLLQQVALINSLVSPVPFTPPMAELSDKKMRYNPDIFWYNTNKPFPVFDRVDELMLNRRRNILIKAEHIDFNKERKLNCLHCEKKWRPHEVPHEHIHLLDDFHHLRFGIHKDVTDKSEQPICYVMYEDLMNLLKQQFEEFRRKDMHRFQREVDSYRAMRENSYDEFEPVQAQRTFQEQIDNIVYTSAFYKQCLIEKNISQWARDLYKNFDAAAVNSAIGRYVPNCKLKLNVDWLRKHGYRIEDLTKFTRSFFTSQTPVTPEADTPSVSGDESDDSTDTEEAPPTVSDIFAQEQDLSNLTYAKESMLLRYIATDRYRWAGCGRTASVLYDLYTRQVITSSMFDEAILTLGLSGESHVADFALAIQSANHSRQMNRNRAMHGVQFTGTIQSTRRFNNWNEVMLLIDSVLYVRRNDMDMQPCIHWRWTPQHVSWNRSTGWVCDGQSEMPFACDDNAYCSFNCHLFKRAFLRQLLIEDPILRSRYRKREFDMLPEEYREDCIAFPKYEVYLAVAKAMIQNLLGKMSEVVKKIWTFFNTHWTTILSILIPISIITMVTGASVKMAETDSKARVEIAKAIYASGTSSGIGAWSESPYGTSIGKAPTAASKPVVPQSLSQQYDLLTTSLKDSFFYLTVTFDGKIVKYRCLRLRMNEVLILRHYDDEIRSLDRTKVKCYGRCNNLSGDTTRHGIEFDYFTCKILWYNNVVNSCNAYPSSFGVMHLPLLFPMAKDITKFIARAEDHTYVSGTGSIIEDGKIYENLLIERDNKRPYTIRGEDISTVQMDDVYTYGKHGKGMCGSVLLSTNLQRPIIGMHVAGYGASCGTGLAEILTAEMFINIEPAVPVVQDMVMPLLDDKEFAKINIPTAIFPYGCVTGNYIQAQSGKTQYVASPIQGVYPVEMEPNPLSPTDKRLPKGCNPLDAGIANKGLPPIEFNNDLLDKCAFDLETVILANVKPARSTVGVLKFEQAVLGVPSLDGYDKLEMSTSVGHPLSSIKPSGGKGKTWLFTIEEQENQERLTGVHEELKRIYTLEMSMRQRGIKPFTVFVDCLKDTCLPVEKCRVVGKTRIFSISPVQFSIAFRQYCLDFMASYQNARFNAEHAIGINPQSLEWTELTARLLKNSKHIVTGDYKNFGPGLMKSCVLKAKDIILSWYKHHGADAEHLKILDIMFFEIIDAYYLGKNLIYQTPCGIPSGSPITAPLNSLVNSLYVRYVYMCLVDHDFSNFHSNVTLCTYGDDIIMSVKPSIIDKFNSATMSKIFKLYNITFTDQDKTSDVVPFRDISTATFLKRNFVNHPTRKGVWIGQLEKRSIQNILNWVHRKGNIMDNLKENARSAFQLAVEWGPEYYDDMVKRSIVAAAKLNIVITANSWKYWDNQNYSAISTILHSS